MIKRALNPVNLIMTIIYIIYCIYIIARSKWDMNGFVTSDSAHYLQLAQNLLNGNGLNTANYVEGMSTFFAVWPAGYPILIALISLITGTGVFWASKIVNMLCLALCFILLKKLFGNRAILATLLFSISSFCYLFIYTWSEVPFLLGMLWLVFGIKRYMESQLMRYILHMIIAALLMFFSRYIGIIGGGIIGLIGFYYLFRKEWKPMLTCWIAGSLSLIIAGVYLLINFMKTGLFTGMERIPRVESASQFMNMLRESLISEVNIFSVDLKASFIGMIVITIIAIVLFIRPRNIISLFKLRKDQYTGPVLFLLTGTIYMIAIVYMRWSAYFDTFNFRLLAPATFMFWLFIISWTTQLENRDWKRWRGAVGLILISAFIFNIGYITYTAKNENTPTYKETTRKVNATYEQIPKDSIVAFENFHARYLRPDIQFIKVYFRPYFGSVESVHQFKERITPNNAAAVFLQEKSLYGYQFDRSFVDLMEQAMNEEKDFIKLDDLSK